MGLAELGNAGLRLGLGTGPAAGSPSRAWWCQTPEKPCPKLDVPWLGKAAAAGLEPALTLGLGGETCNQLSDEAVSSFSNGSVKRERELGSDEAEIERVSSRIVISDEDDDGANARKKLRLNKDQSAVLEESFKRHSTLNPRQKQELSRKLNLRPRQVEVWFQNRRARTKLKQTEVDCELLKKCCEKLRDENKRLQKEVQELKALKLAHPLYMQLPAATLSICPSCERTVAGGDNTSRSQFLMPPKTHLFPPFNPSAAC
ncbi:homeobox-leucine zipper protein HAT22-like [Diospyros lotus]|uniref:homeobox-leucine zipper protein HAT22-like n=1 Tax=Diospyros lotus TaxID=55363 RepID=UPI00224D651C|nr:homeobox-leucine zipper protein HAT22-like [Diospyros lotus]